MSAVESGPRLSNEVVAMRLTKWTDYTLRVLMHCAATQRRRWHPPLVKLQNAMTSRAAI